MCEESLATTHRVHSGFLEKQRGGLPWELTERPTQPWGFGNRQTASIKGVWGEGKLSILPNFCAWQGAVLQLPGLPVICTLLSH